MSTESEMIVIGTLISSNEYIEKIEDNITSEDISDNNAKMLFDRIKKDIYKNGGCNIATLGKYAKANGFEHFLAECISKSTISDLEPFLKDIKETSIRNNLFNFANELINTTQDYSLDIFKELDILRSNLTDLETKSVSKNNYKSMQKLLPQAIKDIERKFKTGFVDYIPTSFIDFDSQFGGLNRKELFVLGARPSMGKSTFTLQLGLNISKQNTVMYFTEEMSVDENFTKILANQSRINSLDLKMLKINEKDIEKIKTSSREIYNNKFYFDDKARINPRYIRRTLYDMKRKGINVDVVMLDYLQITDSDTDERNEIKRLGEITKELKAIAKEYNCCVLCLSQLSRGVEGRENKRPSLSDLRSSGNIEQDADVVAFCFRSEYYLEREVAGLIGDEPHYQETVNRLQERKNEMEINIKKNRNGALGTVKLFFKPEYSLITDKGSQQCLAR